MDEVKYYMEETLLKIAHDASATETAITMRDQNVGSLVVEQDGKPVGIITEADVSRKIVADKKNPDETKARDIMTQPIISIDGEMSMAGAFLQMRQHNIRHIAVMEEKELSGILSIKDFANYYTNKFGNTRKK